jgi:hypothetical protein
MTFLSMRDPRDVGWAGVLWSLLMIGATGTVIQGHAEYEMIVLTALIASCALATTWHSVKARERYSDRNDTSKIIMGLMIMAYSVAAVTISASAHAWAALGCNVPAFVAASYWLVAV